MDRLRTSKDLLTQSLRAKSVVLVLGPGAVQIEVSQTGGTRQTVPFYCLLTDELLKTYDTALPEDGGGSDRWLLHRAAGRILADRLEKSPEALRRAVSATIKNVVARAVAAPLLERVAKLRLFDLIVCLTPDDCLVNALTRVDNPPKVCVTAYAPNADTAQPVDVPPPADGQVRVFFPLGRAANGSRIAVHEEDALEFLYKFQEEGLRRAPNLLAELRTRDMLLLGCNLPDWLGRGFLRLANESRLSSDRGKMEFLAADDQDARLDSFLSRFDPNAVVFPWSTSDFVAELETISQSLAAAASHSTGSPTETEPPRPPRAAAAPTVFLSYASEDTDAARHLATTLVPLGFGDVWFDKHQLIAGDNWSDRIDAAIEQCDFFMPVLSHQADIRREGVFWAEWQTAVKRSLRVKDAFLLPVGVDPSPPARSGYGHIFDGWSRGFRDLQLLHAPAGMLTDEAQAQLREVCRRFGGGAR